MVMLSLTTTALMCFVQPCAPKRAQSLSSWVKFVCKANYDNISYRFYYLQTSKYFKILVNCVTECWNVRWYIITTVSIPLFRWRNILAYHNAAFYEKEYPYKFPWIELSIQPFLNQNVQLIIEYVSVTYILRVIKIPQE